MKSDYEPRETITVAAVSRRNDYDIGDFARGDLPDRQYPGN
jgi:hypothetical protein